MSCAASPLTARRSSAGGLSYGLRLGPSLLWRNGSAVGLPGFVPLAALQFALDGFTDKVGALLLFLQNGIDPGQRTLLEASRHLLVIDLLAAHTRRCG